jgi:MIT (microtubule interacting and transport) domain
MPSTHSAQEHQPFNLQYQTTNSSPSSSIVTVQRAASIGPSRSVPRPLASLQDIQTSIKGSNGTANFSKPVKSRESRHRQSTTHSRSSSVNGVRDGVGNLNRWSQSTTSSKGSASHTRSDSFSRRMSFGGSGAFTFAASSSQSPSKSNKTRPSAAESPPRQPALARPSEAPSNPATSLPPLVTLSTSQQVANLKSSPLTAASSTPSTAGLLSAAVHSIVPDYFTSKTWEQPVPRDYSQSKIRERSPIDSLQLSTAYATKDHPNNSPAKRQRQEVENGLARGHSRNRSQAGKNSSSSDRSKDRATKRPSQKAMLSIALQKANTAVLLDNAQNFEGAMQAYAEACDLLQQVMMRSSGDEDKRKLDAIVS